MMIKKIISELRKLTNKKYLFGCVLCVFKYDKTEWNNLLDIISEDDLYLGQKDEDPKTYGKEDKPHVTILYGLHDVKMDEIDKRMKEISKFDIKFGKASLFKNELFDVIKINIKSEKLHEYNKLFKELPNTNRYNYNPHATIAYVKKDCGEKYLDKINEFLKKDNLKLEIDKIEYSSSKGEIKLYDLK